jgi:hypothetical protein
VLMDWLGGLSELKGLQSLPHNGIDALVQYFMYDTHCFSLKC